MSLVEPTAAAVTNSRTTPSLSPPDDVDNATALALPRHQIREALRLRARVDDVLAAQALFVARAVERIVTAVSPKVCA